MNTISAERRRRREEAKAEIERLKAELAEKDDEIERLHDETLVLDTDRVWDLEQQVAALKRELASHSGIQQVSSSPAYEWTRAARDPYSDDFMELDVEDDDEVFGEATRAELVCSTPTRRMCASFPTPPATSPEPQLPQTPCRRQTTPRLSTGVQTSLPDPERRQLEEELESLQLEVSKLTTALESYSNLTSRLSDKLAPFSADSPSADPLAEHPDLEAHLTTVLQTLSDRTAALAELDSSLKSLGFPGSDAFEVIDSLRAGFRSARLELEYLTPGEITLPLTGAGAEVLDLVLTQLRALAKSKRTADESIDEYHALEFSLRKQLNARVTATDSLASQLTRASQLARQKDARISELEVALERLKQAARTYTRDIAELEALVERMETDLTTTTTTSTTTTAANAADQEKDTTISTLQTNLASALAQTTTLQSQLAALQTAHAETIQQHKNELAGLSRAHGASLAQRDARVAELRAELARVDGALRGACDAAHRLRVENGRLVREQEKLAEENGEVRRRAQAVVDGVRGQLEWVVRMGEGLLGGGDSGGSVVDSAQVVNVDGGEEEERDGNDQGITPEGTAKVGRSLLSGDLARSGRGSKRRRYDCGLGFLDEEEIDGNGDA